jgi:hypothetical protein
VKLPLNSIFNGLVEDTTALAGNELNVTVGDIAFLVLTAVPLTYNVTLRLFTVPPPIHCNCNEDNLIVPLSDVLNLALPRTTSLEFCTIDLEDNPSVLATFNLAFVTLTVDQAILPAIELAET